MQQLILIFLFIIFLVAFSNCDTTNTYNEQKDATVFFDKISDITGRVEKKTVNFSNYFRAVAPLAKSHSNYELDKAKIDSLTTYYNSMANSLDNSITKLKHLKEFDKSFNTINLLITNYQIIKNGYDSTIPIYISVYKNGWTLSSPSQKETIMSASNILNRSYEASLPIIDSFGKELTRFIKKYNIKY